VYNSVNGIDCQSAIHVFEKLSVQAFQRWLRANERPDTMLGIDWDYLKAEALTLLEGDDG
jgi:hypothetical protein